MESADEAAARAIKTAPKQALTPYQLKEKERQYLEQAKEASRRNRAGRDSSGVGPGTYGSTNSATSDAPGASLCFSSAACASR
jgi:hypothetical protein